MKINKLGIDLIKQYEGCKLNAYLCPANVPTIGYGSTYYEDLSKVKIGDTITNEQAEKLLINLVDRFSISVKNAITSKVNENQFSAIVSFAYNCGLGNLRSSTLLKKVNLNPLDITIKDEFMKWNKGGGKVLMGLTRRRESESNLYFKSI